VVTDSDFTNNHYRNHYTKIVTTMTEHENQKIVVSFCNKHPELSVIFAIGNGGLRDMGTAIKMKAEGVKKGIPDLFLPLAKNGFNGLFIEMKIEGGRASKEQKEMIEKLNTNGYRAVVCVGYKSAIEELKNYAGIE
jgi:hypothetical protein